MTDTTTTWWDHAIEIAILRHWHDGTKQRVHWSTDTNEWCVTPAVGK